MSVFGDLQGLQDRKMTIAGIVLAMLFIILLLPYIVDTSGFFVNTTINIGNTLYDTNAQLREDLGLEANQTQTHTIKYGENETIMMKEISDDGSILSKFSHLITTMGTMILKLFLNKTTLVTILFMSLFIWALITKRTQ